VHLLRWQEKAKLDSKKVKAVDTTAAGDSFIGALVTGLVEGKTLEDSIEFATYVAALTVTNWSSKFSANSTRGRRFYKKLLIKNKPFCITSPLILIYIF